ncbi:flavin reductase family protein [Serratia sp. T13T92]|uniref:flavin reductase family protein n=1 Tax=Serratia sp. T13T92 TaxID=3397496 RepID=UPI0039E00EF2
MLKFTTKINKKSVDTSDYGREELLTKNLRNLLGTYPTGVAIVTMRKEDGTHVGLTINSFASLSLEPPLILWSLVNYSSNLEAFRNCSHFAINILSIEQQELAIRFATQSIIDKFSGVQIEYVTEGLPVIKGALTTLICENYACSDIGDHMLVIGRIVGTNHQPSTPLIFHAGSFTSLQNKHS